MNNLKRIVLEYHKQSNNYNKLKVKLIQMEHIVVILNKNQFNIKEIVIKQLKERAIVDPSNDVLYCSIF